MVAVAFPAAWPPRERTQGTEEREGEMVAHTARAKKAWRAGNLMAVSSAPAFMVAAPASGI
jgi:hypothetical protein